MLQNPNSLVANIFREKYFPNGIFLEAVLGRKPSYAWRSILSAKPLMTEGLLWRVGDGSSIRIWKDKWIPMPTLYAVQTPVCGGYNRDTKG
jgi:hypothetical protein